MRGAQAQAANALGPENFLWEGCIRIWFFLDLASAGDNVFRTSSTQMAVLPAGDPCRDQLGGGGFWHMENGPTRLVSSDLSKCLHL